MGVIGRERLFTLPWAWCRIENIVMRIEAFGLTLDTKGGKLIPVSVQIGAAQIQHVLGTLHSPTHAGAFHAVFDEIPAGPFDDIRGAIVSRALLPRLMASGCECPTNP